MNFYQFIMVGLLAAIFGAIMNLSIALGQIKSAVEFTATTMTRVGQAARNSGS